MGDKFVKVTSRDAIKPGNMQRYDIEGRQILVANIDGKFYATDDTCTHEDASLYLGCLQGEYIKCSLHGARFNMKTGQAMDYPAEHDLRTYPVKVEGSGVWVDIAGYGP